MYTDLHFNMTNLNTDHKRKGRCKLYHIVEKNSAVTVMAKWKLPLTYTLPNVL